MSAGNCVLRTGLVGLALMAACTGLTRAQVPSVTSEETIRSVRRTLERLPYYGVFDFIAFGVHRGTVKLVGYSYQGGLKSDAENATKRAKGVDEIKNEIEVLPVSLHDDRIRWETFYRIYSDDFLSRYVPGGASQVLRELRDEANFPGMQPVGIYPIHIIVKSGRTTLLGIVDSAFDRQLAEVRAREVSGVFAVENGLVVAAR